MRTAPQLKCGRANRAAENGCCRRSRRPDTTASTSGSAASNSPSRRPNASASTTLRPARVSGAWPRSSTAFGARATAASVTPRRSRRWRNRRRAAAPTPARSNPRTRALPRIAGAKFALLRRLFDDFIGTGNGQRTDTLTRDFAAFRAAGGDLLQLHARFAALHADRLAADPSAWSWRTWPAPLRDPNSAAVEEFASRHAREVLFHSFLQWLADRSFAAAQKAARAAGMQIGLIADLAVGMDSSGSHAWSRQSDILVGLDVGAPPDLFNARGQNWGLTAFSPRALVAGGFAPFIATLRAGMRNAGGLRIDHAMSLTRLWLIPEGAKPDEGAYLAYPLDDLLRLTALESWRHRALVIGEDLGTVPTGV